MPLVSHYVPYWHETMIVLSSWLLRSPSPIDGEVTVSEIRANFDLMGAQDRYFTRTVAVLE